jgi:hypothetical protein
MGSAIAKPVPKKGFPKKPNMMKVAGEQPLLGQQPNATLGYAPSPSPYLPSPPIQEINVGSFEYPSAPQQESLDDTISNQHLNQTIILSDGKTFQECEEVGDPISTRLGISSITRTCEKESQLVISYGDSDMSQVFDFNTNTCKRAFKHQSMGVVASIRFNKMHFYFYKDGSVKMFANDVPSSLEFVQACTTYQVPLPKEDGAVKSCPAYSKNVRIYNESFLVYLTADESLIMYSIDSIEKAAKLGAQHLDSFVIPVNHPIQSFGFLPKTFSPDRIVVLTRDGRLMKFTFDGKKPLLKREATIPDQIDPDVVFTEVAVSGDNVVVASYNSKLLTSGLVLFNRSFEVQSRLALTDQSSPG